MLLNTRGIRRFTLAFTLTLVACAGCDERNDNDTLDDDGLVGRSAVISADDFMVDGKVDANALCAAAQADGLVETVDNENASDPDDIVARRVLEHYSKGLTDVQKKALEGARLIETVDNENADPDDIVARRVLEHYNSNLDLAGNGSGPTTACGYSKDTYEGEYGGQSGTFHHYKFCGRGYLLKFCPASGGACREI